jgi:glycerol-3-phosphate dehydrogenase (NAD(P)+)
VNIPDYNHSNSIAVLGAGAWGTALAVLLARNGIHCYLWGHRPQQIARLQQERQNHSYLPGISFPPQLMPTDDLNFAVSQATVVLLAVPSEAFIGMIDKIQPLLRPTTLLCWATKGFAPAPDYLLHKWITRRLGASQRLAILSGPSFAQEVALGQPTAITVAAPTQDDATQFAQMLHNDTFRVYTSSDITGIQVGGASKNVIAIAAGIADGLGFGANTRAALITRGLHECMRLGVALGGKAETFMGLAGMGDLVLTCTDNQSRNRRFGYALGQGQSPAQARAAIGQVVEGASAAQQIVALAQHFDIEMPISTQVYTVIQGQCAPRQAVQNLLAREPKSE